MKYEWGKREPASTGNGIGNGNIAHCGNLHFHQNAFNGFYLSVYLSISALSRKIKQLDRSTDKSKSPLMFAELVRALNAMCHGFHQKFNSAQTIHLHCAVCITVAHINNIENTKIDLINSTGNSVHSFGAYQRFAEVHASICCCCILRIKNFRFEFPISLLAQRVCEKKLFGIRRNGISCAEGMMHLMRAPFHSSIYMLKMLIDL